MMRDANGRSREEHRIVMEGVIGRPLRPYETVHHKDGDRLNNAPGNLELWVSRHGRGVRVVDIIPWCVEVLTDHGYVVTPPGSK